MAKFNLKLPFIAPWVLHNCASSDAVHNKWVGWWKGGSSVFSSIYLVVYIVLLCIYMLGSLSFLVLVYIDICIVRTKSCYLCFVVSETMTINIYSILSNFKILAEEWQMKMVHKWFIIILRMKNISFNSLIASQ